MTRRDLGELLRALLAREHGATMMEYAVVLVMVAIGAVAAYAAFGAHLADFWAPFSTAF